MAQCARDKPHADVAAIAHLFPARSGASLVGCDRLEPPRSAARAPCDRVLSSQVPSRVVTGSWACSAVLLAPAVRRGLGGPPRGGHDLACARCARSCAVAQRGPDPAGYGGTPPGHGVELA